ncbi:asparagine synthase (glutamine-hydrolyzing) [Ichthyenterobacterium sp. W332]|uniref:asparagine synthase (glutamine-hydrolyzing) n=1 Tax=Microcosmobacter mediterraneus TaxID=3075607 RepID=A0ABU2YGP1_9FLAO|nr:asparagine synthase (glutamine-hydrolyzing) [Ichthyenterobacterium sp. W332]MDT0557347.1 asparagine synthase (glutamine-hydrolyzing) [Ichthyenterobacterium sp. W332]
MCGFLTEFCFKDTISTEANCFKDILALSKHRGPDASHVISESYFQLGFNRLAILDLSENGNQPKQSKSGRYHVVFNGEIYNFKALAKHYSLSSINSASDTEVLIDLLDAIGIKQTIKNLNGMFAISIVDTVTKQLYLARDFAGIKPLFYGKSKHGIVAASQFNQVFKHQWHSDQSLRLDVVKEYFAFGYMQAPNTIYKNIFQVNPGELVEINISGDIKTKTLLKFPKTTEHKSIDYSRLDKAISDAVNRQLVSDVPLATFLSGGIDSPLVSAYAKASRTNIEAFTLKVNDKGLNESELAKSYAEALEIKQHIISVEENSIIDSINAHFKAFSEPFGDYSSIPTYVISKESKKKHTVMLSGDGGDELFFGYPRMLDVINKKHWFILPRIIRKPLIRITNKLGITNTWSPYLDSFNEFIINKHTHLPSQVLDNAIPKTVFSDSLKILYTITNGKKAAILQQLRWNEFYAHLQRVLIKVDRASMINSLEVRVPLLDKNVIENAWQTTENLKSKSDLKRPLKQLLSKKVPENLVTKQKKGFAVPLHKWLQNDLKNDVLDIVNKTKFYGDDVFNAQYLRQYVKDYYNAKHNNFWGVWHIYAWQKWAKLHLN